VAVAVAVALTKQVAELLADQPQQAVVQAV
jgi:hypothetical protein